MSLNKRLFRYLNLDQLRGLVIFWAVIILTNILGIVFSYYSSTRTTIGPVIINDAVFSFAASNVFALFVYFVIYGLVMYFESFTLSAIFGVTRKNFYLHAVINNIMVVVLSAIIQIVVLKIENIVMVRLGYEPMVEFGLFNMNNNIILNMLLIGFLFLVFASLTNLIGTLQYRFGARFWIVFGLFVFVMTVFAGSIGVLFSGLVELAKAIVNGYFLLGIIFIILAYGIGFILIRKADVK